MTFGVLVSLTVVGLVVLATPVLLRPTDGPGAGVIERFGIASVVGVGAAVLLQVLLRMADPARLTVVAEDLGFWTGTLAAVGVYVGRRRN